MLLVNRFDAVPDLPGDLDDADPFAGRWPTAGGGNLGVTVTRSMAFPLRRYSPSSAANRAAPCSWFSRYPAGYLFARHSCPVSGSWNDRYPRGDGPGVANEAGSRVSSSRWSDHWLASRIATVPLRRDLDAPTGPVCAGCGQSVRPIIVPELRGITRPSVFPNGGSAQLETNRHGCSANDRTRGLLRRGVESLRR
jgi:hypothetical protein